MTNHLELRSQLAATLLTGVVTENDIQSSGLRELDPKLLSKIAGAIKIAQEIINQSDFEKP